MSGLPHTAGPRSTRRPVAAAAASGAVLACIWWVLSAGDAASWIIGGATVAAATATAVVLRPADARRLRFFALLRFLGFFLLHSLTAGFDVAWRALVPRMPIAPELHDFSLRLPPQGPSRAFLAGAINLMPGTLVADIGRDRLVLHVLAGGPEVGSNLIRLENLVAGVFGHTLLEPPPPAPRDTDSRAQP